MQHLSDADDEICLVDGVLAMNELSQLTRLTGPVPRIRALRCRCSSERVRDPWRRHIRCVRREGLDPFHHPYDPSTLSCSSCSRGQRATIPMSSPDQADALPHLNNSPIVRALAEAAEAGEVGDGAIELKARFDEGAISAGRAPQREGRGRWCTDFSN